MLVAVPVTASIGVIARYLVSQYQQSRLYQGETGRRLAEQQVTEDADG